MKPWNDASSPVQATPMKLTLPLHFCAAASTEGASRLQTLQVGAQNQKAVGAPATDLPSKVPPPTNGALKFNAAGIGLAASVAVVDTASAVEDGVG
jgi:hypothetical protein